jgi:8-oxo-dGTP diphosphatase
MMMKQTTQCYLERGKQYLMLHRTKKVNDENHDKWIGVGGHFEDGETPEECVLREVLEETGLTLTRLRLRGIVTFLSDIWEGEYMYLFTSDAFEGQMKECDEGELVWVEKDRLGALELWEGDYIFLDLLDREDRFFSVKLRYEKDKLAESNIAFL